MSIEFEKTQRPNWIKVKINVGEKYNNVRDLVDKHKLHTICQSGNCPNMGECWNSGTATFMILGNICTRSCRFCAVKTGKPNTVDWKEAQRVADSIKIMNVKHAVITSVDRDDLKDGGSLLWVKTIEEIRKISPNTTMETLIPDFKGEYHNIDRIIKAKPEIISHNLETVRRLTKEVRIQAKYERSLDVLRYIKESGHKRTKSGIMLGLGEEHEEVIETLEDLKNAKVDIVTIGQYLQPTKDHLKVKSFPPPEKYEEYKQIGIKMGFKFMQSSPLTRSSYHAQDHLF